MIDKNGSLRCYNCDKEILLSLEMIEGKVKFYCPRCHHYQEIKASTTQLSTVVGQFQRRNFNSFYES